MSRSTFVSATALLLCLGCSAPHAPVLSGLGTHSMPVPSLRPETQPFFDQGLRLLYAFNFAEAERAFREASRLDPDCAMAWWGIAMANGPSVNHVMTEEDAEEAEEAIERAVEGADGLSERDRGLVLALHARHDPQRGAEQKDRDSAYRTAMQELAAQFPADADVGTLAIASFMETRPWDYWAKDGTPYEGVADAVRALEGVLAQHPLHAGAIHYYIHLVEASLDPDRAVPHAERLAALMPSAGHMVHMPSHVWMRVGRYADASASNVAAIAADEAYIAQCNAQGMYPQGYYPHNVHFLWSAASMEGRSAVALENARKVEGTTGCCTASMLSVEDLRSTPLFALVRFGKFEEVLAAAEPPAEQRYASAMYHYARGFALAARGRLAEAERELAAVREIETAPELAEQLVNFTPAPKVVRLAANVVDAEIRARRGDIDGADALLREAIALQDSFRYMEPPTWSYPVRQHLGAVLLAAGRPAEAEAAYREDLVEWRENGWSLFGLAQALDAQGKAAEAAAARARFEQAWAAADVKLAASVFR